MWKVQAVDMVCGKYFYHPNLSLFPSHSPFLSTPSFTFITLPLHPSFFSFLSSLWWSVHPSICQSVDRYIQKCRLMRCMLFIYDKQHKVSSFLKSHQNAQNSVKYEVIWKWHSVMLIPKEHRVSLTCISGHKCPMVCLAVSILVRPPTVSPSSPRASFSSPVINSKLSLQMCIVMLRLWTDCGTLLMMNLTLLTRRMEKVNLWLWKRKLLQLY